MDEKRLHYRFNCCSVLIELLEHTFHSKRGICGGDYDSYLCIVWVYCDCDLQPLWTIHYPKNGFRRSSDLQKLVTIDGIAEQSA